MNTKWKKVLEGEKEYKEILLASGRFRDKLSELIEEEILDLEICDDYDVAHWELLQAEVNGKRKALKLIQKIIKEKD